MPSEGKVSLPLTLATLKKSGFERVGSWTHDEKKRPALREWREELPVESGIYLFVLNDTIKYVGVANNIRARLGQYAKSFQRHIGPRLVDRGIADALKKELGEVIIYVRMGIKPRISYRGGLPFDDLAGLEAGLIEETRSEWNKGARKRLISTK